MYLETQKSFLHTQKYPEQSKYFRSIVNKSIMTLAQNRHIDK